MADVVFGKNRHLKPGDRGHSPLPETYSKAVTGCNPGLSAESQVANGSWDSDCDVILSEECFHLCPHRLRWKTKATI